MTDDRRTVDSREFAKWWKRRGRDDLTLILWAAWDPIGAAVPLDEYENYSDRLMTLLRAEATVEEVAGALARIRTETIGMPPDSHADETAAHKLLDWYDWAVNGGDWNDPNHPPPQSPWSLGGG
jgi:hypothetical protein